MTNPPLEPGTLFTVGDRTLTVAEVEQCFQIAGNTVTPEDVPSGSGISATFNHVVVRTAEGARWRLSREGDGWVGVGPLIVGESYARPHPDPRSPIPGLNGHVRIGWVTLYLWVLAGLCFGFAAGFAAGGMWLR